MPIPTRGSLGLNWVGKGSSLVSTEDGQYGYDWVSDSDPRVSEVRRIEVVRRIGEADGENGASSNLLILGDNVDVLRSLNRVPELSAKYLGKIKLCYIDPPFNTGGVFGTHYEDALEHSIWLSMMNERLRLIQPLLSRDGSIWVHVDENESHRMRLLLDEVFGIDSYAGEVVWQKTYAAKMDAKHVPGSHDTIFIYRQRGGTWEPKPIKGKAKVKFPFVESDGRPYATFPLRKWGSNSLRTEAPSGWFPVAAPNGEEVWPIRPDGKQGTWRWGRDKIQTHSHLLEWKKDRGGNLQPYVKQYAQEAGEEQIPVDSWWDRFKAGTNKEAKRHLRQLFPEEEIFSTPKPERLLARIIEVATDEGDMVLDCFAGSGTTAATAHKLGRRWITCELSESNIESFILPRLRAVIDGVDEGGISQTTTLRFVTQSAVSDAFSPEQAIEFNRMLRLLAGELNLSKDPALKLLREMTKTVEETDVRWDGGGGFTYARLADRMYESFDGSTVLTAAAKGENFAAHVAGQLGFFNMPRGLFAGKRGNYWLAVIDGVVFDEDLKQIVRELDPECSTLVVAGGIDESARRYASLNRSRLQIVRSPDYLNSWKASRAYL